MGPNPFKFLALCLTVVLVVGCTGTMQKRRAVERPPTITEEDLKTDTPRPSADQTPSAEIAPPSAAPQQQIPPSMGGSAEPGQQGDPSERRPTRYRWEDKRGGQRGWQPAGPQR